MSQKIKILIADDINKIAEDNKNIVSQNENVEIVGIASNGQEEMEMILEFTPDLVITDNKMPIINGIEVIEKINATELNDKPDFILFTGDYSSELNKKCRELGVYMILDKLTGKENLLGAIDDYIRMFYNNANNVNTNKITKSSLFDRLKNELRK
jgi:response regulator of citrate/malate metabolism